MNEPTPQDIQDLKAKADRLGVKYHPTIGAEALLQRVREKQEALENGDTVNQKTKERGVDAVNDQQTVAQAKTDIRKEATKLVRLRITNMNPKKKDLQGELITVGNEFIGTISKFIPFGPEFSENGYHVPNVIYQHIKEKKFLNITQVKDRTTGRTRVSQSWAREYALEVLPPLTKQELDKLAAAQKASGSIDVIETSDGM